MKSWGCIEFAIIPISLTGLLQPFKGAQFIAWRRKPQESRTDPRRFRAPEGGSGHPTASQPVSPDADAHERPQEPGSDRAFSTL